MRRIFWSFCRNWFLMSPLHYLSSRSDFGFEFAEIFIFEKRLPAITDTGIRRLHVSVIRGVVNASLIRGVADSPHHWYAESATPHITDMQSRRLPTSPIRRVAWIFLKKTLRIDDTERSRLPAPVIRWVADSPYRWVGESPTPRITDTEVDDSAYRWFGESTTPRIGDTGSGY